ncbi:hypothetical protein LCGC14_0359200 [marine sediment metagenome]|uniref:HTH cro/C1-type domain-containing protein n=1 Tax=marine sediment metagenome TaxID=412755 RepID=A0A0F9T8G0_9ZZZZ|nr:XRE family transcriptional regulator [Candidatus Aminicenantes bacterium]
MNNDLEYRIRKSERKLRLGDKLCQLRKAKGWTQDNVARKLCVSSATISNIENGTQSIYAHDLPEWADIFNCSIEEILK